MSEAHNILILERVFGYAKHTSNHPNGYFYWKKPGSNLCYVVNENFYPSPTDDNRFVPNFFDNSSLQYVGRFLKWFIEQGFNIKLTYNKKTKYYTLVVDNWLVTSSDLVWLIANQVVFHIEEQVKDE